MIVLKFLKASEVTFINTILYTIQTVLKQLHTNEQENNSVNTAKCIMQKHALK